MTARSSPLWPRPVTARRRCSRSGLNAAPRVAWLSVDEGDNDPESLLAYAAAALDRVEPIDLEWFHRPAPRGLSVASSVVPQLAGAMYSMSQPVSLFLDHVDLLHNRECLDAIAELALHLPAGSQLAMATRSDPPLPMARLRAGRSVLEIGVPELMMNEAEARALLAGAGLDLPDAETAALLERTEGWPVGLYLAALALKAGGDELRTGLPFSGDDRLMADYLRAELLARLSDDDVTFLTRTSVLDRMSGGLCDAVLDGTGSARCSRRSNDRIFCWSRSTGGASGTGITVCSATCCAPSCNGANPR